MRDDKRYEPRSTGYGRKVCQALLYLAEGYSQERAATSAGVKHITLWAWMQEEAFAAVLACLQEYAKMRWAFDALDGLLPDAVEAMRRTMQTGSPGQALQAARDVMNRVQERADRQEQAVEQARGEVIRRQQEHEAYLRSRHHQQGEEDGRELPEFEDFEFLEALLNEIIARLQQSDD